MGEDVLAASTLLFSSLQFSKFFAHSLTQVATISSFLAPFPLISPFLPPSYLPFPLLPPALFAYFILSPSIIFLREEMRDAVWKKLSRLRQRPQVRVIVAVFASCLVRRLLTGQLIDVGIEFDHISHTAASLSRSFFNVSLCSWIFKPLGTTNSDWAQMTWDLDFASNTTPLKYTVILQ